MQVKQLDHINLSVDSLSTSVDWYARVFGFSVVERGVMDGSPWAILKAGEAMLALYEDGARTHHDRFSLKDRRLHGLNHFALRVDDRAAWESRVLEQAIPVEYEGAVEWPHSVSWYLVDPTGYQIEVVHWNNAKIAFHGA